MSFWPSATSVSRTAHGLAYARGRIGFAAPGRPPALRLVLGHAVGFSKEAFAPTLVALGRILEQRRCEATWIALDFSGHGASREPPPEPSKWNVHHAEEIEEIIEVLGDEAVHESEVRATLPPPPPLVGFGWSMGGAVLASAEVRRRHTFEHILMYEPPLFTRSLAALAKLLSALGLNMMANSAAKRRRVWPSLADARSHLLRRSGRSFAPAAIDAWVEGPGFRPHAGGRDSGASAVELSCDPKYEARAYSWPGEALPVLAQRYGCSDGERLATEQRCSFTLAVGEASQFSPIVIGGTGPAFYRHFLAPHLPGPSPRVVSFGKAATHLAPMEHPELVAEGIAADLEARGLLPGVVGSVEPA